MLPCLQGKHCSLSIVRSGAEIYFSSLLDTGRPPNTTDTVTSPLFSFHGSAVRVESLGTYVSIEHDKLRKRKRKEYVIVTAIWKHHCLTASEASDRTSAREQADGRGRQQVHFFFFSREGVDAQEDFFGGKAERFS